MMSSPIQNKSHGNMPHYMGGLNADDSQNESKETDETTD